MAIDGLETTEMILELENFCEKIRPADESIRKELDFGYTIENQSVFLFEIRPDWKNKEIIRHSPVAKATFIKTRNVWKVYWMRANLKWYPYNPVPTVSKLKKFLDLVAADEYHCFFG